MAKQLLAEEQAIIDYVEDDDSSRVDDLDSEINRYTEIACAQMGKHVWPFLRVVHYSY